MIRPPPSFMTMEGRLLSVRTVINILHFSKPINCIYMYHMKTGVFQTDLNHTSHLLPFLSIQCMSRRDLSVKGGTSERCYRTRRGRTDEQRYAIISPYFDGRIKMNGPYPEITNISFLAKTFFKTFISLKHLSDYRTVVLSDRRTVGLSDCRIITTAPVFSGVRVNRSLALCVCCVDRCLSICSFFFGHCVSVLLRYTDSDYLPLVSSNSSYISVS